MVRNLFHQIFCALLFICLLLLIPSSSEAKLEVFQLNEGESYHRSLESLRALDYQTWQVVCYQNVNKKDSLTLRIVGYPGNVRLDHPTDLTVDSGRHHWLLKDKTLLNKELANDPRDAAAEFDITPLIKDLTNNRPLRLSLQGIFNDLPIPPYLVGEWRSLLKSTVN